MNKKNLYVFMFFFLIIWILQLFSFIYVFNVLFYSFIGLLPCNIPMLKHINILKSIFSRSKIFYNYLIKQYITYQKTIIENRSYHIGPDKRLIYYSVCIFPYSRSKNILYNFINDLIICAGDFKNILKCALINLKERKHVETCMNKCVNCKSISWLRKCSDFKIHLLI